VLIAPTTSAASGRRSFVVGLALWRRRFFGPLAALSFISEALATARL